MTGQPAVSFDLIQPAGRASELEEAPVFRLDLPGNPQAAALQLEQIQAELQASTTALDTLPARLEALVQTAQVEIRGRRSVSFEAASSALPPPETEALELLAGIEQEASGSAPAGVSFGLERKAGFDLNQAIAQFRSATQHIYRLLAHLAWVETQFQGVLLGRTAIHWSGHTKTVFSDLIVPESFQLHQRSLALALTSRLAMLRMFFLVTQGAGKLSLLLSSPAGPLLALPVVWKFASQLLAEVEQFKTITTQTGD